ncbi:hypothetical protein AB4T45_004355 [Vibrio parahaemolyticus]|nr:hypothetical protein [Vibrio parahaemolyticus]
MILESLVAIFGFGKLKQKADRIEKLAIDRHAMLVAYWMTNDSKYLSLLDESKRKDGKVHNKIQYNVVSTKSGRGWLENATRTLLDGQRTFTDEEFQTCYEHLVTSLKNELSK